MRLARWRKTFGKSVVGRHLHLHLHLHLRHLHLRDQTWNHLRHLPTNLVGDQVLVVKWSGGRTGEEAGERARVHLVELDKLREPGKLGSTTVQRESCR